jgi:hypothetical protein
VASPTVRDDQCTGIAVLGVGVSAIWTGIGRAQAISATAVSTPITVNPDINETFAPPPANAAPAMTATQAWAHWDQVTGENITTIASNATVQLGLLTLPVCAILQCRVPWPRRPEGMA